jgi:hypothetical protein
LREQRGNRKSDAPRRGWRARLPGLRVSLGIIAVVRRPVNVLEGVARQVPADGRV